MTSSRLSFIDWMKCLGILLIVYGHVATGSVEFLTPPIYVKQLGVAFFLFVTGFSLAREKRSTREVLFNRLFEIYLYGVLCALVMSAITYVQTSRLNGSNYFPLLFGINVAFDNFPANPTTWYIGTYLHVLLVWAFILRGIRVRPWMLVVSVVVEIVIRASLAGSLGLFVAYMALPNWITVFLLGLLHGQRREEAPTGGLGRWCLGFGLLLVAWPAVTSLVGRERSFPFMEFTVGPHLVNLALTSAAVSFLYLLYPWMLYQVTRRLRAPRFVEFIAANTLVIFVAHMPLYFALQPFLGERVGNYWVRVGILFTACSLGLGVFSEALRLVLRPRLLRDKLWSFLSARPAAPGGSATRPVVPCAVAGLHAGVPHGVRSNATPTGT